MWGEHSTNGPRERSIGPEFVELTRCFSHALHTCILFKEWCVHGVRVSINWTLANIITVHHSLQTSVHHRPFICLERRESLLSNHPCILAESRNTWYCQAGPWQFRDSGIHQSRSADSPWNWFWNQFRRFHHPLEPVPWIVLELLVPAHHY